MQLLILTFLVISTAANANEYVERDYQAAWCAKNKGETEVVMSDRTRADCVTQTHALEFDFGRKWSEAIGQSLGYAIETNKRAGIVLIVESDKDNKHWIKLNSIIDYYDLPIDTFKITPDMLE